MLRTITLLLFFCTSVQCFAGNDSQKLSEAAHKKAINSLNSFAEAQEECKKSEAILPADTFSGLSLSNEQVKLVLTYHFNKANYECTKPQMVDYLISSSILSHYSPEKAENLGRGSTLITYDAIKIFETEKQYKALPKSVLTKLGKIEALTKPFNLIASADNIGVQ